MVDKMQSDDQQNESNSLKVNLLASLLIILIIGLVNFGYPLLVGLLYGPEIIGNFSVLFYWATLLCIPISNGIAPSISRFIAASNNQNINTLESVGSKILSYYFIVLFIIFPIIASLILGFSFLEIFLILLLSISLAFHYVFRHSLQGQEQFKKLLKFELISFSIFIPSIVFITILPIVLNWITFQNFKLLLIPVIIYHFIFDIIIATNRLKLISFKTFFNLPSISKSILKYAAFAGLSGLLAVGISQIQIVISDFYLIDFELGVLSFWNSIISAITLLSVALKGILVPRITHLRNYNDGEKLAFSLTNSFNWALTFIIVPVVGIIFLLIVAFPSVLDILTAHKYNMLTYWLIVILLCSKEVIFLILIPTSTFLLSSEKYIKFDSIASFVYSVSVIISWILLVPNYGIFGFAGGIAIGSVFCFIFNHILVLVISKKAIGLHIFLALLLFSLVSVSILLQFLWSKSYMIFVSLIFTLPSIAIGIYKFIRILNTKEYSKKMILI